MNNPPQSPSLGFLSCVDQMAKCVAKLEVKSVCWCVGERGHRWNGVVDDGVVLQIVHQCCDGVEQPVEEKQF